MLSGWFQGAGTAQQSRGGSVESLALVLEQELTAEEVRLVLQTVENSGLLTGVYELSRMFHDIFI